MVEAEFAIEKAVVLVEVSGPQTESLAQGVVVPTPTLPPLTKSEDVPPIVVPFAEK